MEIAATVPAPAPAPSEENAGAAAAFESAQLALPMELAEAAETEESPGVAAFDLGTFAPPTDGPVPQLHEAVELAEEIMAALAVTQQVSDAPLHT